MFGGGDSLLASSIKHWCNAGFSLQADESVRVCVYRYRKPSASCDLAEYTSNEHLDMFENVAQWDYPIFELEKKAGHHILSHVSVM